jgi:excisionase family DNA binding protein
MEKELELLTVEEAAKISKVKPRAVYHWIDKGLLVANRSKSGFIRIQKENLMSFLNIINNNNKMAE